MEIDCLIFSRDRACQLDLLLRSIDFYAGERFASITVLYRASTLEYLAGYERLLRDRLDVIFPLETDFERQVFAWLTNPHGADRICFLCDDDLFYRPASEPRAVPWSWRGGDYDYPFSLDGNVYRRLDIIRLLEGLRFRNPTELEYVGHEHRDRLPFDTVTAAPPCLVGVPLNRVSDSSLLPHAGWHEYDLNEAWLAGARLYPPYGMLDEDLPAHANVALELRHVAIDPKRERE